MDFFAIADGVMCLGWIIVYVLVIVSSLKHSYPAISPFFSLVVLPWEIATVIYDLHYSSFGYGFAAHICFMLVHFAVLFVVILKLHYFKRVIETIVYFCVLAALTFTHYILIFRIDGGQLFSSFTDTGIGVLLWILFVLKPTFPANTENLRIAALTVIVDAIGCAIYYSMAGTVLKAIVVLLFLLNCIYFTILWKKCKKAF